MSEQVTNNNPAPVVNNPNPNPAPAQESTNNEPQLILGKFKTQEDLIKAYQELEKKQSKPKGLVDPIPEKPPVATVDVDYDAIGQEFSENGELSEESYNKTVAWIKKTNPKLDDEKAKKVLNQYMAGLNAQAQIQQQEVDKMLDETVGGRDNYAAMVQWASVNLTPEEIEAYDQAVSSNINSARLAIEGLYAKYVKANGNPPAKLLSGDGAGATTTIVKFDSWKDYTKARMSPKYKTDKNYKQMVDSALLRSDLS